MTVVLVAGNTQTAAIEGISAAGADPEMRAHTPAADLELVADGAPADCRSVPVSPTGCPTPAVMTRAVRELLEFDVVAVEAGLLESPTVDTVTLGRAVGGDIRQPEPVPNAVALFEAGREQGREVAKRPETDRLLIGETIPGGTTTALGVLRALGERATVSSSLPENPLERKRMVVEEALAASDLSPGDAAGEPLRAVRHIGDPVLAGVAGLVAGASETDTQLTLAGGTQLATAAALVRHADVEADIELATTAFVAADETAAIRDLAADQALDLRVTDPGFGGVGHPAMAPFVAGEAKEGVGMGGALACWDEAGVSQQRLHDQIRTVYDRLVSQTAGSEP